MTNEEELGVLKQCTDEVMRKYTDDKPISMVLVALFVCDDVTTIWSTSLGSGESNRILLQFFAR